LAALGLPVYAAGRLISVAACVTSLGLVVAVGRRDGGGRWWPWVAALLAVGTRPVLVWSLRVRVDALAVLLSLVGFVLATRGRGRRTAVAAVALLGLACLTKATMVAAPLAVGLGLWTTRRRRGLLVMVLTGVGVFAATRAMQAATGGAYLGSLGHFPFKLGRVPDMATRPVTTAGLWLAACVVGWRALARDDRRALAPLVWYLAITWALGAVSGGLAGASWNYLLETFWVLALLSAGVWAALLRAGDTARLRRLTPLLVGHLAFAIPYLVYCANPVPPAREAARAYAAALPVLSPLVASGQHVAVLHNAAAADALLALNQRPHLDVVDCLGMDETQARELAAGLLRRGALDVILRGPGLEPWHP